VKLFSLQYNTTYIQADDLQMVKANRILQTIIIKTILCVEKSSQITGCICCN